MARGSGSSGSSYSYREWAAAERAAQREGEQRERKAEKDRNAAEVVARDEEAAAKTEAVERRVAELESLLRSSLAWDPRISFDSLRVTATIPPLNLGPLVNPIPAPQWADFAPKLPSGLGRMFGGSQRYQQEPQVRGDRRPQQDFPADQPLDLTVQGVDEPLPLGQLPGRLVVTAQQRLSHPGQILADHSEQLDDLDVNRTQLAVEFTPMLGHSHPLAARLPSPEPAKQPHQETLAGRAR